MIKIKKIPLVKRSLFMERGRKVEATLENAKDEEVEEDDEEGSGP